MFKHSVTPRPNHKQIVEDQGLLWHSADGNYWHESAYYEFKPNQVEQLEVATEAVHQMFVEAGEYLVTNPQILVDRFQIPQQFITAIINSWEAEPPCLNFGRFDFAYNGIQAPKLLEYNCDTPTSLLEAGVIQWNWKEEVFPQLDQFNSIHEKMVAAYANLGVNHILFTGAHDNNGEDAVTIGYHMDLAAEAGITPQSIHINDLGFDNVQRRFVDLDNNYVETIFKLYPWEWMVNEEFGYVAVSSQTVWLEPIWKMMWSNKAILPILWQLFPNNPYLLEASFDPIGGDHVVKPILSREGSNVTVVKGGEIIAQSDGEYGEHPMIYQRLFNLPEFRGVYPIIGSWCVDGYAAGIGIRESGLITNDVSRFTPHVIR